MKHSIFNNMILAAELLLMAGLATSCKKLIEIPPSPPTQISASTEFSDSASAMGAVAFVYSYTQNTSGFGYSDGLLTVATGLSSDELANPVNPYDPGYAQFYSYGLTDITSDVSALWKSPYTSLYTVNAVIDGVAASTGLSASFKTQITAEMKVMRAFYFFNLVNLFGPIPLPLTSDYNVTAKLPRASVDSVYGQIIADLTDAQKSLSADYPSSGHVRPCQLVATALLARVYLYRQQWQDAYNAANAVISSGNYSLVTDPNQVYLDGSSEAIWQLPATGSYQVTQEAYTFIPQTTGTVPAFPVNPSLINAFEPNDLRMQDWLGEVTVNGVNLYYPYKYKNVLATSPTTEDYMLLRLGEQYLIRAEASAELGNGPAALADVNTVRARAGLAASTADPTSQSAVLAAIMHERQVELFTEWGSRWYDLKRTGQAGTVLQAEKGNWTPSAALYPVPKLQLQDDVNLTQNPGY